MSHRSQATRTIFVWPMLIGLLGAAGLFAALLGDDGWDVLSWLGLGIPAVLGVRGLLKPRAKVT